MHFKMMEDIAYLQDGEGDLSDSRWMVQKLWE